MKSQLTIDARWLFIGVRRLVAAFARRDSSRRITDRDSSRQMPYR
jgi:hypothetical protein